MRAVRANQIFAPDPAFRVIVDVARRRGNAIGVFAEAN